MVGNRKWELPGVGSGEIFGSRGQVVLWNPPVLAEALEKHFDLAEPVSVKEVPPRPTKKTKQNARPTPDDQGVVGAPPRGVEAVRTAVEGERNNVLNWERPSKWYPSTSKVLRKLSWATWAAYLSGSGIEPSRRGPCQPSKLKPRWDRHF